MPKLVSVELSDQTYSRLLEQQRLADQPYLSKVLRSLIEEGLDVLEGQSVKTPVLTREAM